MNKKTNRGLRKMNKTFSILSVLLVLFLLLGTSVKSLDSGSYTIENVKLDSTDISNGDVVYIERGTTSTVEVWVKGNASASDVKIKAWIGGYEYGDIQDTSDLFDVEPGVTYKKTLKLEIPQDFEISDRDTLHVEVYDSDNSIEYEYQVNINEVRHSLNILDVNVNPGLTVEAGKNIFGTVRVENLGDKIERDIQVQMNIPELGLTTKTFIDKLVDQATLDDNNNDNDKVSASSDELFLKIPSNTPAGTYTLNFLVTYNRGHTVEKKTYVLTVTGGSESSQAGSDTVSINVDTTTQTVQPGKGAVFKIMVTNLDNKAMTFTTDVAGVSSWGASRSDPATVTIAPDNSGEMFVYVSANENAQASTNPITLTVKSGNNIVKQIPVSVRVEGSASSATFSSLRSGLEIGFIVLLIVLVILGLILAARKLGGKDEEDGGKTYY